MRCTKSIRRDMLALLSTSSANVAPTASCLTMSSVCGTSSSRTENCGRRHALDEAARSCPAPRPRAARWSLPPPRRPRTARARPCRALRARARRRLRPRSRAARTDSRRPTRSRRAGPSVTVAEQLSVDEEPHLPGSDVLAVLHLRDDPDRAGQAGAAERRRDANAERRRSPRDRDAQRDSGARRAPLAFDARTVAANETQERGDALPRTAEQSQLYPIHHACELERGADCHAYGGASRSSTK